MLIKNRFKLLVLDIDGTLVGTGNSVSEQNREAVERVSKNNIAVSISTGRSLKSSLDILNQLVLDSCHIFFDGAFAGRPDFSEDIFISPIPPDTVKQMVEFSRAHSISIDLFSANDYYSEKESWSAEVHRKSFGIDARVGSFDGVWERERILKCGLVTTDPEEDLLVNEFQMRFNGLVHFEKVCIPEFPGVTFNNILATGVSKGNALEMLVQYKGINMSEVMAVGDSYNDYSLLSTAGFSVAMGNAPEEIKAIADYVTLDVEENGLAYAINKFILEDD